MAYWESKFKTHRVRSADVGKDYGIFQINSFKWCEDGTPGGKNQCKVPCSGTLLPLNRFHVTIIVFKWTISYKFTSIIWMLLPEIQWGSEKSDSKLYLE